MNTKSATFRCSARRARYFILVTPCSHCFWYHYAAVRKVAGLSPACVFYINVWNSSVIVWLRLTWCALSRGRVGKYSYTSLCDRGKTSKQMGNFFSATPVYAGVRNFETRVVADSVVRLGLGNGEGTLRLIAARSAKP